MKYRSATTLVAAPRWLAYARQSRSAASFDTPYGDSGNGRSLSCEGFPVPGP